MSLVLDERLVSLRAPASMDAEPYRLVRYHCEQWKRTAGVTVVGVTSPAVGDGKTTTAVNIAGSLAQAPGAKVLLVDADLRRPAVGLRLGIEEGSGLVGAILDPGFELEVVVRRPIGFNLSVLPAGQPTDQPYEMLSSPRVAELLGEARQAYEYVIVDTPPLLVVPDCRALSAAVDAFLMVVAAHKTPRQLLAEALGALEPGKVRGLVFNYDDRPLSGYYKRYYGGYARPAPRESWWRRLGLGRSAEGARR